MSNTAKRISDFRKDLNGEITSADTYSFPKVISTGVKGRKIFWQIVVKVADISSTTTTPTTTSTTSTTTTTPTTTSIYNFIKLDDKFFDGKYKLPNNYVGWIKVIKHSEGSDEIHKTEPTIITSGKNIGKKNETNVFTQALYDAFGKYTKQSQKSTEVKYSGTIRYPPMLISLADTETLKYTETYIQRKLNGVRVVAVIDLSTTIENITTSQILLYSRTCKDYLGKKHIRDALCEPLMQFNIEFNETHKSAMPNTTTTSTSTTTTTTTDTNLETPSHQIYLDGELYIHGVDLQIISGEARADTSSENPNIKIQYHIYDLFIPTLPDMIYAERKILLEKFMSQNKSNFADIIIPVETYQIKSEDELIKYYNQFLNEKYEGAIIRFGDKPYKYSYNGYHTKNVLKMKPVKDDEYIIVDIAEGENGKSDGALMWVCAVDDTLLKTFTVTPMGTIESRKADYIRMTATDITDIQTPQRTIFETQYKGKKLTVRFDELSADNVPLRARAVAIRDYE
jgi:hypothetical protein